MTKSSRWFLEALAAGAFEIARPAEIDRDLVPEYAALHERSRSGGQVPGGGPPPKAGRPVRECCRAHRANETELARAFVGPSIDFDCCRHVPCSVPRYLRGLCAFVRGERGSVLP